MSAVTVLFLFVTDYHHLFLESTSYCVCLWHCVVMIGLLLLLEVMLTEVVITVSLQPTVRSNGRHFCTRSHRVECVFQDVASTLSFPTFHSLTHPFVRSTGEQITALVQIATTAAAVVVVIV